MWKKTFGDNRGDKGAATAVTVDDPRRERALVGPSICISGGLSGEEDVIIQGRVEGTIDFKNHSVTIGQRGRVKADIFAKEIVVEGELIGDLHGSERVAIHETGKVRGDIKAPRVTMQDGALFKGSVDMEPRSVAREEKPQAGGVAAVGGTTSAVQAKLEERTPASGAASGKSS